MTLTLERRLLFVQFLCRIFLYTPPKSRPNGSVAGCDWADAVRIQVKKKLYTRRTPAMDRLAVETGLLSDDGRYKMGTLSRMTGLKPELLRAWQRRFSLFEPERTEGGHRLYTPDDLRVAVYVQELLSAGQSIGEVARRGRPTLVAEARTRGRSVVEPARDAASAGRRRAAVDVSDLVDTITGAAVAIDADALDEALDQATEGLDVEAFLSFVVGPASRRIGDLWERGECSVAGEHLASSMFRAGLLRLLAAAQPPLGAAAPEAILACAPGDYHENGALTAAIRLAGLGWRVVWLGGSTPLADLDKACRTRRPHAVYLSCTLSGSFAESRDALVGFARRWSGAFELVVGGQGVPEEDVELSETGVRLSRQWIAPTAPVT
jgi:MerR family transcriptional regulator, light-induced transcriptional regulator